MSAPRGLAGLVLALAVAALVAAAGLYAGSTTVLGRIGLAALMAVVAALGAFALRVGGGRFVRRSSFALGALGALAFAQTLPLPPSLAGVLAPYATSSREAVLGAEGGVRISFDADASRRASFLLVGMACLLAVGATRLRSSTAPVLARALALVALCHAALALWLGRYGEDDPLFLGFGCANPLTAYGSFPNRAQFAAFELLLLGGPFFLMVSGRRPLDRLLALAALGTASVAIAASGSRAGLVGLVAAAGGAWISGADRGGRRRRVVAIALVVAAIGAARVAGVGPLVRALPWRGDESVRLDVWRGAVDLAVRQPVAGAGFDVFGVAYPGEGREPANRLVTHAENDLLQLSVEGGLLGLALAAWGATAVLRGARSLRRRAAEPARRSAALAACAAIGVAPLALTSVPLHAPAVALAALAAGFLVVALLREDDAGSSPG